MKILLLFLLLFSVISANSKCYSIIPFLNYLSEKGYYSILRDIAISFGIDISISTCEGFVQCSLCEVAIKDYICPRCGDAKGHKEIEELMKFLLSKEYYNILRQNYTHSQIIMIINKIIKNAGGTPIIFINIKDPVLPIVPLDPLVPLEPIIKPELEPININPPE